MPRIALCNDPGCYVNDGSGTIVSTSGSSNVTMEGRAVALVGDRVHAHYDQQNQHADLAATLIEGSSTITIGGIPVVLEGHHASCGHVVIINTNINGSSDFDVSGG